MIDKTNERSILTKVKNLFIQNYEFVILGLIIILSFGLHYDKFQQDIDGIHIWRQCHTQTNIQNFHRYDLNILNPRSNLFNGNKGNIVRFEFPIMQWVIGASYSLFGDHISVTRYWMFLFASMGFVGFYFLSNLLSRNKFASLLISIIYFFSPIIYYYSINPMPDMFALTCSIWFLFFFFKYLQSKNKSDLFFSAAFISLATLAKLPYVLFGASVLTYAIYQGKRLSLKYYYSKEFKALLLAFSLALLFPFIWYASVMKDWPSGGTITGILVGGNSFDRNLDIINYHFKFTLKEMLFNLKSVWLFYIGVAFILIKRPIKNLYFYMFFCTMVLLIVYFIFELNIIDIIHDYYMLPFMVPLYLITLYGIVKMLESHIILKLILAILFLISPKTTVEATIEWWSQKKSGAPIDWVKYKDELRSCVPDDALCIMLNDDSAYILPYLVNKQGYCFHSDSLPMSWIDDMVRNWKVKYMYSNSRKVDTDPEFQKFVDKIVFDKGNTKVFKLKLPQ